MNLIVVLLAAVILAVVGYKAVKEIAYIRYKLNAEGEVDRQDYRENSMRDLIRQDC